MGQAVIPLAAAAISAAGSYASSRVEAARQQKILDEQERIRREAAIQQERLRQEEDKKNLALMDKFKPDQRQDRLENLVNQQKQVYQTALKPSTMTLPTSGVSGRVSGDFLSSAENARDKEIERTSKLSDLQAQLDAASLLRQYYNNELADAATHTNMLGGFSQQNQTIANQLYNLAGRKPHTGYLLASGLISGVANGLSSGLMAGYGGTTNPGASGSGSAVGSAIKTSTTPRYNPISLT